jgi:streptogramin lyase
MIVLYTCVTVWAQEAGVVEGDLLMLDDRTPHVAVPVQAIRDGKVIATVLSDEAGKYHLADLKPGNYQIRCQVLGGYVYYGGEKAGEPESQKAGKPKSGVGESITPASRGGYKPISLHVERGKTLKNIDFRFPPFKKGAWRNYSVLHGLASEWIRAIHRSPDGVMWFGTEGGGVSRYDGRTFVNFTTRDGLAGDQVNFIHDDPDGVIWFGTDGGISRYDSRDMGDVPHFVNLTTEDGLIHNNVLAIHRQPDGVMWFGTSGGVSQYDARGMGDSPHFLNFTTRDGLANNRVKAIYQDPNGVVWFGSGDWQSGAGGISRYDGRGMGDSPYFVNFTTKDGLAGNYVWAIYGDPDGVMWFGTNGGVSRYDGRGMGDFPHFVNFTTKDGLAIVCYGSRPTVVFLATTAGVWGILPISSTSPRKMDWW